MNISLHDLAISWDECSWCIRYVSFPSFFWFFFFRKVSFLFWFRVFLVFLVLAWFVQVFVIKFHCYEKKNSEYQFGVRIGSSLWGETSWDALLTSPAHMDHVSSIWFCVVKAQGALLGGSLRMSSAPPMKNKELYILRFYH